MNHFASEEPQATVLPPDCIRRRAGIGATHTGASFGMDGDCADPTDPRTPVLISLDDMSPSVQGFSHLRVNTGFNRYLPRQRAVWPERVGKTVTDNAGRLDCLLWFHSEFDDVKEHLQHPLNLGIAAGTAKGHKRLSIFEDHRRVRCESWTLPRLKAGWMRFIQPRLCATR